MVLFGLLGLASCDKISNNSEHLDNEYVGISSWVDDWSGDYIIAQNMKFYTNNGNYDN